MAKINMAVLLGISAAGLYGLLTGCSPAEQQRAGSTLRMAERLEAIADSVDPATHPYVNSLRVDFFRHRVEQLRDSVAVNDSRGKVGIMNARYTLASELLRAGRSEEAAREYRAMYSSADHRFRPVLQMLVGVSYLRLGEQENCLLQHSIDSCLLPIRSAGLHRIERGSRTAIGEFLAVLDANPEDLGARWLLNLACMTLGEYPHALPEALPDTPRKRSQSDSRHREIRRRRPGSRASTRWGCPEACIMEDFDGDGHLDIIASSWGLRDQIRYFRNRGDGTIRRT